MRANLPQQAWIIFSTSLLMLLPACGGRNESNFQQQPLPSSTTTETSPLSTVDYLQESFFRFEKALVYALTSLTEGEKIDYQAFQKLSQSLTQFQVSINKLKQEPGVNAETANYLDKIQKISQEIEFILENLNPEDTEKIILIQEKLGLDFPDGDIVPGGTTSKLIQDYLMQRTERIKSLVQSISDSQLLDTEQRAVDTEQRAVDTEQRAGEKPSLTEKSRFFEIATLLVFIMLAGFLAFMFKQELKINLAKLINILKSKENDN